MYRNINNMYFSRPGYGYQNPYGINFARVYPRVVVYPRSNFSTAVMAPVAPVAPVVPVARPSLGARVMDYYKKNRSWIAPVAAGLGAAGLTVANAEPIRNAIDGLINYPANPFDVPSAGTVYVTPTFTEDSIINGYGNGMGTGSTTLTVADVPTASDGYITGPQVPSSTTTVRSNFMGPLKQNIVSDARL